MRAAASTTSRVTLLHFYQIIRRHVLESRSLDTALTTWSLSLRSDVIPLLFAHEPRAKQKVIARCRRSAIAALG
jgi:hypothetical protein